VRDQCWRDVEVVTSVVCGLAVVAISFGAAPESSAHPGGTDEDGCHVCRSNCEKWDAEAGKRHCHGGDESDEEDSEDDRGSEDSGDDEIELSEAARVYVDKVLDGDTLLVRPAEKAGGERVRIRVLGIDCPESHKNPKCRRQGRQGGPGCEEQIPRGKKAAEKVAELIKHEVVRLESKGGDGEFGTGGYDRTLAYVRLDDGRDLGKHLVEDGVCRNYGDKYPHPRHEEYESSE